MTNRTRNQWRVCRIGKMEIFADHGVATQVMHRGKFRFGKDAAEYVEKHGKSNIVRAWCEERDNDIQQWKHETPHRRYSCDGGCLAIRVNGVKIGIGNGYGDGDFPVYILPRRPYDADAVGAIPPTFIFTGVSLGECRMEVLDYDCDGGVPLETIDIKAASFYHDDHGAVVIEYDLGE